jgi:hypothetical protein
MWKLLVVGGAALLAVGSWTVLAQPAPDRPNRPLFSREDAAAFLEARIAALHAGLQLTPEQERQWPAFEQAYRERGKLRLARVAAGPPPAEDPIARLQRRADALTQQGAVLKRLADAAAPLWQSFDEGQKRRFAVLVRPFSQRTGLGFAQGDEPRRPGRDGGRFGFGGAPGSGGDFGRDLGPGFGPRTGPGGPPGRDGPRLRFGGPAGRDGDDFGYGRPRGREGGFGPEGGFGRDPRDGRDPGRDFGRGQYRGRGFTDGDGARDRRESREDEERL